MIKVGAVAVVTSAIVSVKKGSIRFRAVVSDTIRRRQIQVVFVVAVSTVIAAGSETTAAVAVVAASAATIVAASVAVRVAAAAAAVAFAAVPAAAAPAAVEAACPRKSWVPARAS